MALKFRTLAELRAIPAPTDKPSIEVWHESQKGFGVRIMKPNSRTGEVLRTYIARHKDEHGKDKKPKLGSVDTMTFDEAWDKARHLLSLVRETKETGRKPAPTLGEAFKMYLKIKENKLSDSTVESYKKFFKHLDDASDKNVLLLGPDWWLDRYMLISTRNGLATAVAVCRVARAIYNMLAGFHTIRDNPLDGLTQMDVFRPSRPKQRIVHADKLPLLWQWMQTKAHPAVRDYMLFELMMGLRRAVNGALRWSQVDMERRMMLLEPEQRGNKSKEPVWMPIPDYLFDNVLQPRAANRKDDEYIIPSPRTGGPLVSIRGSMETLCAETGIRISDHDLRRTFSTIAQATLRDIVLVGRMMTHNVETKDEDHAVTSGYIITSDDDFRRAFNDVAAAIVKIATTGTIPKNIDKKALEEQEKAIASQEKRRQTWLKKHPGKKRLAKQASEAEAEKVSV